MEIFQDKDAKISFLQKAIDVVVIVSGEPLSAKPARIVAGHEPERTNELLQRIGKCCLSKVAPAFLEPGGYSRGLKLCSEQMTEKPMAPPLVLLPGKSQGWGSLVG